MNAAEPLPAYFTVPEAARYLRISESLLRRLLHEGSIESKRFGRLIRVPASALDAAQAGPAATGR